MIPTLEVNREYARKNYLGTDEEFEQVMEMLDTVEEFPEFDVRTRMADHFINYFKGYEDWYDVEKHQIRLVDYGYGLTFESVKKYIADNFGESDPDNNYFIMCDLMSMEYEKPWKQGSFIDLSGNDTGTDYYDTEDGEKLDQADVEGYFIAFSVYDINREKQNKENN